MKTLLRVPTLEQYAYLEFEYEGTAEDAIAEYRRLTEAVRGAVGLDEKEFNEVMDIYLATKKIPNGADLYAQMSLSQQSIIQAIKRSFARTKNNE